MFQVLKFLLRLLGYGLLACAVIAVVADGSKTVARSEWVMVPLGQLWFEFSPATLNLAQAAIQRNVSPVLWDPVIQTLLAWPAWAVFAPLGLVLLWLGARRAKTTPAFV
ncbi:MAG: hypothetical protein JJ902_00725 [Roseibium sp.]|nr:hypothetical protein [Roseibium sp.]